MRNTLWRKARVAGLGAVLLVGGCASQTGSGPSLSNKTVETYVQGVYAYQAGRGDQAAEALRDVLRENPQLIMPKVMLGRIYKEKGDYAAAVEIYQDLVQRDASEPDHHYQLGVSYQMLQRLREAVKSYENALKLDPNNFGANMNLGLAHLALGNAELAVKYTDKAARLKPDSAEAQANLAVALDSQGEYALAEKAYRKSLELSPLQAGTLINYGNNLLSQGKSGEAVQVWSEVLKMQDTPYVRKRLGDALAMGGKTQAAIAEYRGALTKNPKYFSAMNELGRVMMMQYQAGMELDEKLRDEALGLWRQSLEVSPNQPKVKASLQDWEKRMFSK